MGKEKESSSWIHFQTKDAAETDPLKGTNGGPIPQLSPYSLKWDKYL